MRSTSRAVATSRRTTTVREFVQRFSSTPRAARLARLLVVEELDRWGVARGGELSDGVALVVAELTANAVTHGFVAGRDFEVRVSMAAGAIRVAVSDARGERLPPATNPRSDFGRGLTLVAEVASEWGVEPRRSCGKTVWAVLRK
ncbi:ATP-binding protein [Streptomyces chilikensis]|uniref:ATP-binding protein n=1 Tax=Streptomyces chilikensis TaxID=1194079 RepID=A0ABV3ELX5_9ACTN